MKYQENFVIRQLKKKLIIFFDEMIIMTCLEYSIKYDLIEEYEDFGKGDRSPNLAKYVLVFLARGIYSKWKITLAYFLSSSNVKSQKLEFLIKTIINKLFDVGMIPTIVVSDQVSTNQAAMRKGSSVSSPFFFVNGRKLFSIFDTPHCIKNLRNNLIIILN